MNPHRPHTARVHGALLHKLFVLERSGQFDQALEELGEVWDDTTGPPNVEGLDPRTNAETYLRCGAIIGFLGHIRQIPTAQDRSKNLLTAARSLFLEIYDPEKIAECENYLALAYWRCGETNEATSWVEEAQSHELAATSPARLYSQVISNLVLLSQRRFEEICSNFADFEQLFLENADDFLIGNLYMNFGVACKNLGDIPRALDSLLSARSYSERSGNKIQVAIAENNLSQLYKSERKFEKAHAAIDHATELFGEIRDRTREGFSLDSKALIYFDEGKYKEALETVERALAIIGKSENYGYLTETIATKAKIQLYSNDFSTATLTLLEAVEIAKVNISEEAAVNLVSEFEQTLKQRNAPPQQKPEPEQTGLASGDLKLSLPPSISHYDGYQGVWINNSDLEAYGLACGSLAVVVPCAVRRGDLVAVIELENDLVSCGFFDSDFGIVCLEVGSSEPQLFSEADIKVLGKIVGVCNVEPGRDETLKVQPLTL